MRQQIGCKCFRSKWKTYEMTKITKNESLAHNICFRSPFSFYAFANKIAFALLTHTLRHQLKASICVYFTCCTLFTVIFGYCRRRRRRRRCCCCCCCAVF